MRKAGDKSQHIRIGGNDMYIDIDRAIEALKGCTNETDRQIAAWLEELKTLRLNSCMIHLPERLQLVENGYNKALNNVESEFLMCDKVHYNLQDILCVINKLKEGGTE